MKSDRDADMMFFSFKMCSCWRISTMWCFFIFFKANDLLGSFASWTWSRFKRTQFYVVIVKKNEFAKNNAKINHVFTGLRTFSVSSANSTPARLLYTVASSHDRVNLSWISEHCIVRYILLNFRMPRTTIRLRLIYQVWSSNAPTEC